VRCVDCDYIRREGEEGYKGDIGRCPNCGSYYYKQKRECPAVASAPPKPRHYRKYALYFSIFIVVLLFLYMRLHSVYNAKSDSGSSAGGSTEELNIPSDPAASYTVIGVSRIDRRRVTIDTKRVGSSGVTYSRRLVDCESRKLKYLGTGDTYEEMLIERPDENMSDVIYGSIAYYVLERACREN